MTLAMRLALVWLLLTAHTSLAHLILADKDEKLPAHRARSDLKPTTATQPLKSVLSSLLPSPTTSTFETGVPATSPPPTPTTSYSATAKRITTLTDGATVTYEPVGSASYESVDGSADAPGSSPIAGSLAAETPVGSSSGYVLSGYGGVPARTARPANSASSDNALIAKSVGGAVGGGIVLGVILAGIFFWVYKRRRRRRRNRVMVEEEAAIREANAESSGSSSQEESKDAVESDGREKYELDGDVSRQELASPHGASELNSLPRQELESPHGASELSSPISDGEPHSALSENELSSSYRDDDDERGSKAQVTVYELP